MKSIRTRKRPGKASAGFTIVELAVTVSVLGILAVTSIPNFLRATERAHRGSCLTNQRNLALAASLYVADTGDREGEVNSSVLLGLGYTPEATCACPADPGKNPEDYDIVLEDGDVVAINCLVRGEAHRLEF